MPMSRVLFFIILFACLNSAALLRKDNPVAKTQTDPIRWEDKQEELKEGVKGAPSPSMKFYANETFLVDAPVDKNTDEDAHLYTSEAEPSEASLRSEDERSADFWWTDSSESGEGGEQDSWWMQEEAAEESVTW